MPPDTFFTASPRWEWDIILYFFVGGIAGGCFLLAALLHFFGRPEDRPVIRIGFYVACVGALLSGLVLTVDLSRPDRFWHMLIQSHSGRAMFKGWSPMSVGVWGLLLFGLFASLAALGAVVEEGRFTWRPLRWAPVRVLTRSWLQDGIAVAGSVFGLFLAGYTGVLLSVTNRPLWADSPFLGALFLCSGASTAAAALLLLGTRRKVAGTDTVERLARFDRGALALELLVLVLFLASLGPAFRVLVGWWGLLLVVTVSGGIVAPLVLEGFGSTHVPRAATLVLLGGLLLRAVVILSSNGVYAVGSGVTGR
ncbi:MAG TPA: NrfD/PsrC family molybdoenzyme membrane anchor subunit [Gemmatimonadales bacterium]|nr:NrfD/PsrC family molybdoenzyme membrane anchor subunit [Gemmatimonadales bacterium]